MDSGVRGQRSAHISVPELMVAFLVLRHYLSCVRKSHMLIRADNTTVVVYTNKQGGGLRSPQLHRLTLWSDASLLSLKLMRVPGGVEPRSAPPLLGPPSLRGVETSHRWGRNRSARVTPPISGPVRLQGEGTMSAVLLTEGHRGPAGSGRAGARVAVRPSFRIPPPASSDIPPLQPE